MVTRRGIVAGALAVPFLGRAAGAQGAWPVRPLRMVAQFPPGGLVDTVARLLSAPMTQALGVPVVVENRAGAGGVIGTDLVAKAPPDGGVILVSHASVHVFAAATMPTLPFHPVNDFAHMLMLVEAPNVILVRADSPYRTLDGLVTAARTRPVRYGSSGIGSAPHLLGAMLSGEARAPNLDHVPYRGSAPAMQDLLGGTIESMIDPITTNVQLLRDGVLRALAVSSPERLPALPAIPTFAELGYGRLTSAQWLGLSAPRGFPAPLAARLTALMPELLARPEIKARLEDLQTLPRETPPAGEAFLGIIREQIAAWTAVARQYDVVVG